MNPRSPFLAVYPIGDSDPLQLPVRDLEETLPFYENKLGFTLVTKEDQPFRLARLCRGNVVLGLAENGGDPEQASCYIEVEDVDQVYAEYRGCGVEVTERRENQYGGKRQRIFFVRVPDGLCYCIGADMTEKASSS